MRLNLALDDLRKQWDSKRVTEKEPVSDYVYFSMNVFVDSFDMEKSGNGEIVIYTT